MPMRCNRLAALLLALLLAVPFFPAGAEEAPDAEEQPSQPADILVVYPEEADRRAGEDNLSAIAQALFSLQYTADFVEARDAGDVIGQYERVIWCDTAVSDRMDPAILTGYEGMLLVLGQARGLEAFGLSAPEAFSGSAMGVAEYAFEDEVVFRHSVSVLNAGVIGDASYACGTLTAQSGRLPLASGRGNVHYLAQQNYTDAFSMELLIQEIAQWLWPYETRMHTYTQHVVLDAVYPFYDPYRLRTLVDYMVERKMHFVISVMPIYEHSDYPAMSQFCEVLRYAQANGGAVILHAPIVQNSLDAEALAQRLTEATCNYFDQNVYPLALEIPSEWLFREDLQPLLGRYRTLFLSDLDAFSAHAVREYGLKDYFRAGIQQIVPALKLDETGVSHLARCATAVYLDMSMTEDEALLQVIDAVKDAPIPMQSLWGMEQAVYTNDSHYLTWDQNTLTVNGKQRFNVYSPTPYDADFDYKRNEYYRFVANLKNQNQFLIGISAVVLVLFVALGVQSRGQMHRRFLKKSSPNKGGDQHVSS